jgi:hypothetical protein
VPNIKLFCYWTVIAAVGISLCLNGAAEAGGRSPTLDSLEPTAEATRPTIESVSEAAQQEIRACPDSAAISCVAAALGRYAEALRSVTATATSERRSHGRRCHATGDRACARR